MLSRDIHAAQAALDMNGVEVFKTGFTTGAGGDELDPLTLMVNIPTGAGQKKRQVIAPLPALKRHAGLQINQVTVKMKVKLDSGPDGLMVELAPQKEEGDTWELTEIELVYKMDVPAEGVSRVVNRMVEHI
jgi:hypothetical protein